jgi:Ca2+-binding RTX toxin-like protein
VGGAVAALLYGDDSVERSTDGNDKITGGTQAKPGVALETPGFDDYIHGGGGNDIIDGREGVDEASGGSGNDTVSGGEGDDLIDSSSVFDENDVDAPGDAGDDTLAGDGGNDQLRADNGRDKASGGDGDDYLIGTDIDLGEHDGYADTLNCGPGADRVAPSHTDRVSITCETLRVSMYCTGGYPCSVKGTLTGRAKGAKKATTIAKLSRSLDSPQPVDLKLSKKAATKVLGSAKRVSVFAEVIGRHGKKVVSLSLANFHLTK